MLFDPATVRTLLQRGIDNGWWTLEHLDHPSDGYCRLEAELRRHSIPELRQMSLKPHRNLLRSPHGIDFGALADESSVRRAWMDTGVFSRGPDFLRLFSIWV